MTAILTNTQPVRKARNRGQALVEFAVVAIVLYLVLAAIFTFGRAFFVLQVVQQASDVFAHELAETPVAPTATLLSQPAAPTDLLPPLNSAGQQPETPTADQQLVASTVFDESKLQVDISAWVASSGSQTLMDFLTDPSGAVKLPLVNQLLVPTMIMDHRPDGSTWLTYPGITNHSENPAVPDDGHFYVPVLKASDGTANWVRVVETLGTSDSFPLTATVNPDGSTSVSGGIAAIRLNYPFQSASLSSFTTNDPTTSALIEAPASDTADPNFSNSQSHQGGLYGGTDHLGVQAVGKLLVRPYQRILSGQAAYRREVFAAPATAPGS